MVDGDDKDADGDGEYDDEEDEDGDGWVEARSLRPLGGKNERKQMGMRDRSATKATTATTTKMATTMMHEIGFLDSSKPEQDNTPIIPLAPQPRRTQSTRLRNHGVSN